MILTIAFVFTWHASTAAESSLRASFQEHGVWIFEGGDPVLFYQRSTKSREGKWPRAGYVHPLYDLRGNIVTEDFPDDHPHHRGIFWAWHQVTIDGKALGDPWVCKDFQWDVQSIETSTADDHLSIVATVHWQSPLHVDARQKMIPVVSERSKITVYPAEDSYRVIDFDVSIIPIGGDKKTRVQIGGSDDEKGYGGFSVRIKLNPQQRFVSHDGEVEPVKKALNAGSWIDITDDTGGVVMIEHPENPGKNGRWILRRQRSMQNPVFPGRHPVALHHDEPLSLRYRLVIHHGGISRNQVIALENDYRKLEH